MAKKDRQTYCKSCGSSDVSPVEARAARESGSQRMKCNKCGFEFLVESSGRKTRKLLG
jgi:transposase-like protein